jgi:hypothetical protein
LDKIVDRLFVEFNFEEDLLEYLCIHECGLQFIQIWTGSPFTYRDEAHGDGILVALLESHLQCFAYGCNRCINALHLHPFFGPLLVGDFTETEDVYAMKLRNIMDEGYYLLTKSIPYNEENLDIFEVGEEVDASISFGEDADIVSHCS